MSQDQAPTVHTLQRTTRSVIVGDAELAEHLATEALQIGSDGGQPDAPLFERLVPFADQWLYTDVATSGPISRSVGDLLAVLGCYDEAEVHFAHSAASSDRCTVFRR